MRGFREEKHAGGNIDIIYIHNQYYICLLVVAKQQL